VAKPSAANFSWISLLCAAALAAALSLSMMSAGVPATTAARVDQNVHLDSTIERTTTMATGTVNLHRVLRCKPDRVYRAVLDADGIAKWLPPFGFTCKVHRMDPRVGGRFRMSFTNFTSGKSHSFGGEYIELVPGELIHYIDRFDDPGLPGEMHTRITLRAIACGTDVSIVQDGIPDVIPVEMCYLGWQESLVQLAQLVEPEIPD
jgi:uncharacterized protein YndB with AHSA1/START domain